MKVTISLENLLAISGVAIIALIVALWVTYQKLNAAYAALDQAEANRLAKQRDRSTSLDIANAMILTQVKNYSRVLQALHESDNRFRILLQNLTSVSVQGYSMDGMTDYWNKGSELMYGYTAEQAIGRNLLDLIIPPEMREGVKGAIKQMAQTGEPIPAAEMSLLHRNGSRVSVYSCHAIVRQTGREPELFCIDIDLTTSKQHENELQAIATLSSALRYAPTRAEMLPAIVEQVAGLLHSDALTIEMIQPHSGDTVVEAAHGAWAKLLGTTQKQGTGINAIIAATLQPYVTRDLQRDPNVAYPEWANVGIRASVGAPLLAQDRLIGFIWVGRRTSITDFEVRILAVVADITAIAIHRVTMHELSVRAAADLVDTYDTTLAGWADALELREHETAGHSKRVVQMTLDLAQSFGFSDAELVHLQRGALLHDIGKMGIPDYILLKPGPLNEDEWQIMRQHPVYANDMLSKIPYLVPALSIPYSHHERWDGGGYPCGLKGEAIPLMARLFSVVDVWDALSSVRPYRPAWNRESVQNYLISQSGKQFDPQVVAKFLELMRSKV